MVILGSGIAGSKSSQTSLVGICAIQGTGFNSTYQDKLVQVRGIVTADFDQAYQRGFFLQEENCDSKSSTSDGIYIYIGERVDIVNTGDRVRVKRSGPGVLRDD